MTVKNVTVIGSGIMGAGIAQVAMTSGYNVVMNDLNDEILARGKAKIEGFLASKVEKGKMAKEEFDDCMGRLALEADLRKAAADADLVIEAASEKFEIKKSIFNTISEVCKPEAVLATNTSSISITKIAAEAKDPSRVIGMHFFNPAPVMQLLELIPGLQTADEVLALLRDDVGVKMGKVVITSKDHAAFIVNSLMEPMINEAIYLLDSGVGTREDIDNGAKYGLRHPMGPLELADLAGLDTVLAVLEVMYNESKNAKYAPCPLLRKMVAAGKLGRKSGHGFYDYE